MVSTDGRKNKNRGMQYQLENNFLRTNDNWLVRSAHAIKGKGRTLNPKIYPVNGSFVQVNSNCPAFSREDVVYRISLVVWRNYFWLWKKCCCFVVVNLFVLRTY